MNQVPHNSRAHLAFTLIEMLVVIGVISILLVAVTPAVNSLSKSNRGKAAVSNFMNAVEQARSLAITSGSATYIVFADGASATPDQYRARSFIVFQDRNFVPVAVSKWYYLPPGISFQPDTGLLAPQDPLRPPLILFDCPGTISPGTPIALPYLKFDPSGMVLIPSVATNLFVKFFSGYVDSSGNSIFTDKTQQTTGDLDQVSISQLTGRPKYIDPYSPG